MDHLERLCENLIVDEGVRSVVLLEHINQLYQAFLLRVFEVNVFLRVREVSHIHARPELGDVQHLPLGRALVWYKSTWLGLRTFKCRDLFNLNLDLRVTQGL